MKIYILMRGSYHEHSQVRIYESKEQAIKDMDFMGQVELGYAHEDETFRTRWIRLKESWAEQCQHKDEDESWPEWEDPEKVNSGRIYIVESDTENMPFQEQFDAIEAWQSRGSMHPLTCGYDSNHPNLEPYFDFCFPGIGIRCPDENCHWKQNPDHPVLNIIYASFLSNRT